MLAFAKAGDQHDLPVGEFQRIVMHVGAIHVSMNGTGVLDAAQVKVKRQAEFRLFQSEAAIGACASRRDLNGAGVT